MLHRPTPARSPRPGPRGTSRDSDMGKYVPLEEPSIRCSRQLWKVPGLEDKEHGQRNCKNLSRKMHMYYEVLWYIEPECLGTPA